MMRIFGIVLIALCILTSRTRALDNRCTARKTCSECMSAGPDCSWCKQEEFGIILARCDHKENLLKKNCTEENIVAPKATIAILKDHPLNDAGKKGGAAVQIRPQRIRLKMRPHESLQFKIVFREAEDYPVDLYYLMDLTYSMRDDKEMLAQLGDVLASRMKNLTKNFRVGFGSFVDKVVLPYVSTVPEKLINPCPDGKQCVAPYGFLNHMSLSNNTNRFKDEVSAAKVSANLDDAEGGFDAIMQVIVCKEAIKWHKRSRKIVLFATDSGFHYAGDGKLGGIVKPNDEECHLDDNGLYTESIHQDYPALSQINRKIMENKVNIIFAVPDEQLDIYNRLSSSIEGAKVGLLAEDSSNIVQLLQDQYDEISSSIELRDNSPSNVALQFSSTCSGSRVENTKFCKGLKVGTTITFDVNINVTGCPNSTTRSPQVFQIYPVGLDESVTIELDVVCQCDCEKPAEQELESIRCHDIGTYQCGICSCPSHRFGRECECDAESATKSVNYANCKVDNTSIEVCSGRGECICGVCDCHQTENDNQRIWGERCEYDDFQCEKVLGQDQVCGGTDQGACVLGDCQCQPGWSGKACECPLSKDACIPTNSSTMCSGHGRCECGQCVCEETRDGRYTGPFCEECPTCKGRCVEYKGCVQCQVFQSGEFHPDQCDNCTFQAKVIEELNDIASTDRKCIFVDELDDCTFIFTYNFDIFKQPIVRVQKHKECPEPKNLVAIIGSVVGTILLVGVAILLVIRLCIYVKDRRDFAKFLEELEKTTWGTEENPIYRKATSKYTNPTYGINNR